MHVYTCNSKNPTQTQKSKVKDQTPFLHFATAKSPIMAVKSISRRISGSMLMIARLTSLP